MLAAEVVARARSQVGGKIPTRYELGRGGFFPLSLTAADTVGRCDCSGFVAWCLGASRMVDHPAYKAELGGWVETSAMVRDARKPGTGMFEVVLREMAQPGMVYVWGDPKSGKGHGHCGIIVEVDAAGPVKVVHCSKGNFTKTGDAVQETGPEIFLANDAIVARCHHVEHEDAA